MASGSSSTPKREHAVIAQSGNDARRLCSKALRRSYVDNNGVIVHEESPEEVSPPAAPKGATSRGSSPTLAPLAPEAPPMATPTPVKLPGTSTSPSASPILVEQNCLGIVAAEVVQEPVVAQPCQSYLPPRSPYNFSYPAVADPPVAWPPVAQPLVPSSLREIFIKHVMCDFTPRPPKEFPTSQWATLEQLVLQLEPYAREEVARIGPQNLRQLITEWYKGHPAFAGLAYSAWGKRLKDMHPLAHPRSLTYKVRSWPLPHRLALSKHVRALCSAAVLLRTYSRTRRSFASVAQAMSVELIDERMRARFTRMSTRLSVTTRPTLHTSLPY